MRRYFFDVHDEHLANPDTNGIVCVDEQAVSATATRILAEIATGEPLRAGQKKLFMTVRDEAGHVVYTSALNITGSWLQVPVAGPPLQSDLTMA
jgi:hypothetical protein